MKYPYPFLQYWYGNFPLTQETTFTDTSIVSSSSVDVVPDMSGKSISGDARFPHLPPSKDVVLKHWTLVSDDLITAGRNSGQYKATFKCNIVDGHGKVCGADRSILHYRGKAVSVHYQSQIWSTSVHHIVPWMPSSRTQVRIMSLLVERASTCILSQNPSLTMLTFCGHTVVACLGT
jgi:hypothetical protein